MQKQGQRKEDREISERAAFHNEIIVLYEDISREYSKNFRKTRIFFRKQAFWRGETSVNGRKMVDKTR
jgi:hypothetical protein